MIMSSVQRVMIFTGAALGLIALSACGPSERARVSTSGAPVDVGPRIAPEGPSSPPAQHAATSPSAASAPNTPGADALPEGEGRMIVLSACGQCHTPDLIASQRLTPAQWSGKVEKMQGWGAILGDAQARALTSYLAASFPADAPDPTPPRVRAPL